MFYGSYTHVDEIIEKIYNRYRFEDIDRDVVLEAAWMGLLNLGVSGFLEDSSSEVKVEDYRGLMPINIVVLKGIRDKDSGIVLIPSTSIFLSKDTEKSPIQGKTYIAGYTVTGKDTVTEVQPGVYNIESTLEPNYAYIEKLPPDFYDPNKTIEYQIKGRYIFCNINNTTLEVEYKGFPIWDDNTPKIPDDSKVIDFLVNYISKEIATALFMVDKISGDKYNLIMQNTYFSQGAARNRILTPDDPTMEGYRRMLQRLIPKPGLFTDGFKNLNSSERLR